MRAPQGWTLLLTVASPTEATLIKGRLEEHDIAVLLVDNGVSIYPQLTEIGVYVEQDDVMRARHLVRNPEES
ncbi:MAG: DUF2007 domain-containing protein [Flavobacteriales bacterium]|nr:DUF2007 domain-containing protein [Flavobacteriales bacterium]